MEKAGVIYIMTNRSFPDYVKIGYADDIDRRLNELNRSECIPFAFRVYATYEVPKRLTDLSLHRIIDKLNPTLRAIDTFNGKPRKKEFYAMSKEDAFSLLEAIAEIHNSTDRLKIYPMTAEERVDEQIVKEVVAERKERLAPFRFSMVDIPNGAELEFWRKEDESTGIVCTVFDDRHVSYKGEIWSLSSLASELTGVNGAHGPCYYKYKGEWLNDLRDKKVCNIKKEVTL